MLTKTYTAALQGIQALPVEVEINATGLGDQTLVRIVGLPDLAVKESLERIRSALASSGIMHPMGYTTVNLAPADVRKEGAAFDLPIAIGITAAGGRPRPDALPQVMLAGELALDGQVRPVTGALPMALQARAHGLKRLLIPEANAVEAGVVEGLEVIGVRSLLEAVQYLNGDVEIPPTRTDFAALAATLPDGGDDMAEIKGQELARRALEVAAAGGHHLLFIGPPGTGKTLLASRLPGILPPLTLEEAMEVTIVHSVAGLLSPKCPVVRHRPFRDPHHNISDAGLLGGQSSPTPGEISMAHHGVLFLDELTEFRRSTLEVMRQPLEAGRVTIARASGSCTFPASFQLVAAMNPCPCGYYGFPQRPCRCGSSQIQRYRAKLSGPLLDRIDIHCEVGPLSDRDLLGKPRGENSATIRARVVAARERQQRRFADSGTSCNARMKPRDLQQHCPLDEGCRNIMKLAINDLNLSARAHDRILRVARTIADLAGDEHIRLPHLAEAIQYRTLDRRSW